MAVITAKMVSELRAKTGCGMMDCKKALVEADGDFEKAAVLLREKGLAKADAKQSRIAAEGIVDILYSDDRKTAAMVEVNTETDFVAKNENFRAFVNGILKTIIKNKPADVDALMQCKFEGSEETVELTLKDQTFVIGEKLSIRRFVILEGVMSSYIHGNGAMGVLVKFDVSDLTAANAKFAEFAKNVALQLTASPCEYLDRTQVPKEITDGELAVIMAQIKNDPKNANKPQQVIEKMSMGKLGKYFEEHCLLEQLYFKDDSLTMANYAATVAKEIGAECKIVDFKIYNKGEGLEKREDNFAEEVANMVK